MHILLVSNIIYHNLLWWIIYFYNSHSKDWREQGHPCCLEPVKLWLTCCGAGPPAISTHTPGCFDIYTLMWQNDCCIRKKERERMIVVVGRGADEQETIKCIGINNTLTDVGRFSDWWRQPELHFTRMSSWRGLIVTTDGGLLKRLHSCFFCSGGSLFAPPIWSLLHSIRAGEGAAELRLF